MPYLTAYKEYKYKEKKMIKSNTKKLILPEVIEPASTLIPVNAEGVSIGTAGGINRYNDVIFKNTLVNPMTQNLFGVNVELPTTAMSPMNATYILANGSGDEFKEILQINNNNLPTPILLHPHLRNFNVAKDISKYIPEVMGSDNEPIKGIYIVEYMRMCSILRSTEKKSVAHDYYKEMADRGMAVSVDVLTALSDKVAHDGSINLSTGDKMIRFVTFIPLDELIDKRYVLIRESGIALYYGSITPDIMHPYSERAVKLGSITPEAYKPSVNILEVEYFNSSDNTPRYYVMADKVIKIYPDTSGMRPDGCTVTTRYNNVVTATITRTLEYISDVGLYETKTIALQNGSKGSLSLKKVEVELQKLQNDRNQLTHNMTINKMELEKKQLELDTKIAEIEKMRLKHDLEMEKIEIKHTTEMEKIEIKHNTEMEKVEIKHKIDTAKLVNEFRVSMKIKGVDHVTSNLVKVKEHIMSLTALEHKMKLEEIKVSQSEFKFGTDIFAALVKIAT